MPKGKKSSTTSAVVTAQTQDLASLLAKYGSQPVSNSVGVGAPTVSQPNPEGLALAINQVLTSNGLKASASQIVLALLQTHLKDKQDLAIYHNKKNGWVVKETNVSAIDGIITTCVNKSGVYTPVIVDPSQVDSYRSGLAKADQLSATAKMTLLASLERQFNTNLKTVVADSKLLAKAIG